MMRRCLVLAAWLFWQGGTTFYALVVIPIGLATLQPPSDQTFVTQQVTRVLNLTLVPVLCLCCWDLWLSTDPLRWRIRLRWGLTAILLVCLPVLVVLHGQLEAHMDRRSLQILDRAGLQAPHRWYLVISGLQWLSGLSLTFVTMGSWRSEDRLSTETSSPPRG